jgi:hypothetical protein
MGILQRALEQELETGNLIKDSIALLMQNSLPLTFGVLPQVR